MGADLHQEAVFLRWSAKRATLTVGPMTAAQGDGEGANGDSPLWKHGLGSAQ
jgi:hypothetical protein